jgi:hypothetical protein
MTSTTYSTDYSFEIIFNDGTGSHSLTGIDIMGTRQLLIDGLSAGMLRQLRDEIDSAIDAFDSPTVIPSDGAAIRAAADAFVSDAPDAPELRCSYCAETVETYRSAYDDPTDVVAAFIEHTAYDHGGRADILELSARRVAIVGPAA